MDQKPVLLELSKNEISALYALLAAAVKAVGLKASKPAAAIISRIEVAVAKSTEPTSESAA